MFWYYLEPIYFLSNQIISMIIGGIKMVRESDIYFTETPIGTWEDARKMAIDTYRGWIFRGDDKKELLSSFDLSLKAAETSEVTRENWEIESIMLRQFKRICHHYIQHIPENNDYLEWFALARHYRMPARFIDFTHSFYIAAYFALAETAKDTIIWAINMDWLEKRVDEKLESMGFLEKDKRNFHHRDVFHKFFLEYKNPVDFIAPVNPTRLNPRLKLQQGVLLGAGNIKKTFEENLYGIADTTILQSNVHKLLLPDSIRIKAIQDLRRMNISSATLFPELEGFCRSLRDHFYLDYNIRDDDIKAATAM